MAAYLILLIPFFAAAFMAWQSWRVRQILHSRLTEAQRSILREEVPLLDKLPETHRTVLEGQINLFLRNIRFTGTMGLHITEPMQLAIAAQACLLTCGTGDRYDRLRAVLVYPSAFRSKMRSQDGMVVTERKITRLGESWDNGTVVLSWQHSEDGALDPEDGHNLVIHEFAHQIDALTGRTNGIPLLRRGNQDYEAVIAKAYQTHILATELGRRTVIDPYGATAPEEFFATATEAFFETPEALKEDQPKVYSQLASVYSLDPASW